jgi:HPt (histidine-containing phosphotransfer) domain-containing protein
MDVNTGIRNCGSEDGFMSVLSVFHQTAPDKADDIEKLYNDGNIEDYTIRVHALKSSARIIGAAELSHLAEELEKAGKSNDVVFIEDNTAKLLEMYRKLDEKLAGFDDERDDLADADESTVKEAYRTITEIAGSMDYGLMDDMLKDLSSINLAPEDRKNIGEIEKLLAQLDWDGIIATAERALNV